MKTLDAVVLDEAIRAVRERNIATLDYAIVVGIETYLRATNPPPMTDNPQPAVLVDAREAIAALTPAPTEAGGVSLAPIETDPHDPTREYIPLPGGWEVQTKGAGSSYRLLDKKTGERHLILSGKDWMGLQAFFTRFAHEVHAAALSSTPAADAGLVSSCCREDDDACGPFVDLERERDAQRESFARAMRPTGDPRFD